MYNDASSPTLINVTFSGNTAIYGGGMYNNASSPTLTNVTFSGNMANGGGGMNNIASSPTLTNVTFSSNSASNCGGGMSVYSNSNPTLTNVTFIGNSAFNGAGGMYIDHSSPTLTNVTFSGNQANYGGGISTGLSSPTLTNVTFSGNHALYGGGMENTYGNPTLINVTFSGNSASYKGGAIRNISSSKTINPIVRNSILWGNSGGEIDDDGGVYKVSSKVSDSIIQGGYLDGTNIQDADPLLASLGNYGGFTQTLALLPGSAAIDAGNDAICADAATVNSLDQRGVARSQGLHCDLGAFESRGFILDNLTGTPQNAFFNTLFHLPLGLTVTSNDLLEPVSGGKVTFTPPTSGASAIIIGSPAVIGADGAVQVTSRANDTYGLYTVTASSMGASSVEFHLANFGPIFFPFVSR